MSTIRAEWRMLAEWGIYGPHFEHLGCGGTVALLRHESHAATNFAHCDRCGAEWRRRDARCAWVPVNEAARESARRQSLSET